MDGQPLRSPINQYGDVLLPTTGLHGGDISSQRVDELDRACLEHIAQFVSMGGTPTAIDIGGGLGGQTKRMAAAGARVTLIDLTDQTGSMRRFNEAIGHSAIQFYRKDVREFDFHRFLDLLDVIYSQRMLSCLRYVEAFTVLERLYELARPGAGCFISAGGLETEAGRDYPHRDRPVENRWSTLSPSMAALHNIFAPECLFTERDLADLLEKAGFSISRSWTSVFGNPKVIASKHF